ncbi:hypothetical protein HG530_013170 [Fusarium avenaceum]|nr:hypothetical protein HG530_013170 [Fusarium avenaceum]
MIQTKNRVSLRKYILKKIGIVQEDCDVQQCISKHSARLIYDSRFDLRTPSLISDEESAAVMDWVRPVRDLESEAWF